MQGSGEVAAHFAANLRRVRKAADLSQEEVGRRSSLHRTEVGLLERGARVPKVDTLVKLAAALEVVPARLLEGIDWIPGEPGEPKPGKFKHHSDQEPAQDAQAVNEPKEERGRGSEQEVSCLGRTFLIHKVCKVLEGLFARAAGGRWWHGSAVRTAACMAARTPLTFGLPPTLYWDFRRPRCCISGRHATEGA